MNPVANILVHIACFLVGVLIGWVLGAILCPDDRGPGDWE